MKNASGRCNEVVYRVRWYRFIVLGLITFAFAASLYSMQGGGSAEGFVREHTIDIDIGSDELGLSLEAMAPGDVVTTALKVENRGNLELGYKVVSTTTEEFFALQLNLALKVGVNECTEAGFKLNGNVLYGPARLGNVEGINVVGEPTNAGQLRGRTLLPGQSEVLCIQISLPLESGNEYQGNKTAAFLKFWAWQL